MHGQWTIFKGYAEIVTCVFLEIVCERSQMQTCKLSKILKFLIE